ARYWLHWVDESGQVYQGFDANIQLWKATGSPRLAALAAHPWVRPLGELCYRGFAWARHPIGKIWKLFFRKI
ncbi:MAG: DCC1-like thiol-disulfide oxidoreductase family protein, partial [Litorivicinus sp.]